MQLLINKVSPSVGEIETIVGLPDRGTKKVNLIN